MRPVTASALRRGAMAAGALGATLAGHVLAGQDAGVLRVAPVLWALMILAAMQVGVRAPGGGFRAWGWPRVLGLQVGAQAVLHAALWAAPWAFGLVVHHHGPLVTGQAVVAHGVLALLITVVICWGEALLERAVAMVRTLTRSPRPAGAPPRRAVISWAWSPARRALRRPRTSRGPPATAPRRAAVAAS